MLNRFRLPHRPRIIETQTPGGPILIHDCTIYRARKDHGPNGDHYTKEQLTQIFTEASKTSQHGIPFMDTHLYLVGPIGRLHKWWFTPDGWLHGSGEVFGEDVLGPERYQHTLNLIKTGQFKDISLSVVQGRFPNGQMNPKDLKLQEISICRRGRHKNCNIKIVEASDHSQSNKTEHHEGKIMSLTVTHDNGSQVGSLDVSKLTPSVEDMVAVARERGVTFSQAEIDDYANRSMQGGDNAFSVAQVILAKMSDVASVLQKQNDGMKGIVQEVNDNYIRQREADIKMAAEYYEEKRVAGTLTEERAKRLTEMAEKLGKDRDAADQFDTMISGIMEAKRLAADNAELTKNLQKQTNAATRAAREANREISRHQARDASPKRAPAAAAATPAAVAKPAAPAASSNAVAPADAQSAPTDMPPNPGALAQQLTPKTSADGSYQYVMVEASAEYGDQQWIDTMAPLAYQGSYAKALPSQNMSRIYAEMGRTNYFDDIIRLDVPPVGKQNCRRGVNTPF